MSTLTTVTIAAGAGDSVTTALESLWANQQIIDKTHADTADPAAPADGTQWIRTDGANNGVLYAMINSVKTEVLFQPTLNVDLDLNGNELKNAIHEKLATGALPAAGAATEGEYPWDSTVEQSVEISSTDQWYRARCNLDGTSMFVTPISLTADMVDGPGTNPTQITDTEFDAWLFDATNEELLLRAKVPASFTGAHDLTLRLTVALQAAEGANDDIKWACAWTSMTPGSGDALDKAETTAAVSSTDIGAANADLDVHDCDITLDYDDGDNPIAAGDLLKMIINLSALAGAGEIDNGVALLYAELRTPVYNYAG